MTTREQVADLCEGDVARIRNVNWPEGTSITGPAYRSPDTTLEQLFVGGHPVKTMAVCGTLAEFEIVSRAPRPLYVNHSRTEPVPGDVVRIEFDRECVVMRTTSSGWIDRHGDEHDPKRKDGLRLLVDGDTGQVVQ